MTEAKPENRPTFVGLPGESSRMTFVGGVYAKINPDGTVEVLLGDESTNSGWRPATEKETQQALQAERVQRALQAQKLRGSGQKGGNKSA